MTKIDQVTNWVQNNTRIIKILRPKISYERLEAWSKVLSLQFINPQYYREEVITPYLATRYDLIRFIENEASNLRKEYPDQVSLINNNIKILNLSGLKDPFVTAVICAIRSIQNEKEMKGVINFVRYRENKNKLNSLIRKNGESWLSSLNIDKEFEDLKYLPS